MFISFGSGMSLSVEGEFEDYKLASQYIHRFDQNGNDVFYPIKAKGKANVYSPSMGLDEKNQFDSKDYFEYARIAFATFWVEAAKAKLTKEHKSLTPDNIIFTMRSSRKDMLRFMTNVGPGLLGGRVKEGKRLSDSECASVCENDLNNYVIDPSKANSMEQCLLDVFKGNHERAKVLWEIKNKCCGGRVLEKVKMPKVKKNDNEQDFGPTL